MDSSCLLVLLFSVVFGGWGFGGNFRIDRSINVLKANCTTPRIPFTRKSGYYTEACDDLPFFPVPNNGALEGNESWKAPCEGDCHLIVFDEDSKLLWESWDTDVTLDGNKNVIALNATCAVVWNTSHLYPPSGRGDGCTSADAAGFPIASLLFTADEIMSGSINHAIRFILPNNRMRKGYYIHPASHYGGPSATDPYSVVYGSRLRLRSDFVMSGYSSEAQVVLSALQKYGMYLSDGGNIALTAQSDWHNSEYSWDEANLGVNDLYGVVPNDFEIMNGWGNNPTQGYYDGWPDCVYNTIPIDIYATCPSGNTSDPSNEPTQNPSNIPTEYPSDNPTSNPNNDPTMTPSQIPTSNPTKTFNPTENPTMTPSLNPSTNPSNEPTQHPSTEPSLNPSIIPSNTPTITPNSDSVTNNPTSFPVPNPVSELFSTTKESKGNSGSLADDLKDFNNYGLIEYAIVGGVGLLLIAIIVSICVCYCKKKRGKNDNKSNMEESHRYSFDNPYTVGMSTLNSYNQTQTQNIVQVEE